MTSRRQIVIAVGSALAAPLGVFAQKTAEKIARMGYLDGTSSNFARYRVDGLRAGLRELGCIEDKSIVIEYRWAEGKYERLPGLAAQLVELKPDVIVAAGTQAIHAAQKATTPFP